MADRIKGITVEIGGDTTGLSKALSGVNKEIKSTQSQLKDVNKLLKLDPTNTALLEQKQKLLQQAVSETKEKLTQLKSVQDQMDAGLKNGTVTQQQYDAWQREIIETENELKNLEQQCRETDTSITATLRATGSKLQEVGGKISDVGTSLSTHVTAPIVAIGAASIAAFNEVDAGLDIVAQKTGATGDELEDMCQIVKDLATEIPTDFETAGAAVGEVNTRFGLTGQALDDLSAKFIKFAQLNDTDVSTSIDNVSSVMNAFGMDASEADNLLDALNATGQATGIDMDTLANALSSNAAQLKEMGLTAQQAAGFMGMVEMSGLDKIADGLMADGILTGAGKTKWHTSTINKILRNEKYMGDALLQKTYTTDFLTKKRIKNNGTVPQYYVEGDHEAIIPKELFMQVQAELVRRRVVHVSPTGKKRSFSCNHCFAQMVFCGDCGELYRRVHWNNHGCKSIVWRCISRLEPTSAEKNCTNRTVNELLLQEVTVNAINQILTERGTFLKQLQANIAKAVVNADTLSPDGIQARLEELQKELIKKANNKQDYDAIADEIFRLRDQKEQSELDSHHREELMNRIKELQDFIAGQEADITEFDEALVKKLIEKITVFADHFTVEFKSGITIDIEA